MFFNIFNWLIISHAFNSYFELVTSDQVRIFNDKKSLLKNLIDISKTNSKSLADEFVKLLNELLLKSNYQTILNIEFILIKDFNQNDKIWIFKKTENLFQVCLQYMLTCKCPTKPENHFICNRKTLLALFFEHIFIINNIFRINKKKADDCNKLLQMGLVDGFINVIPDAGLQSIKDMAPLAKNTLEIDKNSIFESNLFTTLNINWILAYKPINAILYNRQTLYLTACIHKAIFDSQSDPNNDKNIPRLFVFQKEVWLTVGLNIYMLFDGPENKRHIYDYLEEMVLCYYYEKVIFELATFHYTIKKNY